jgi:membrane associated rhomboid family serine protease
MFDNLGPVTRTLILINVGAYALNTMAMSFFSQYLALRPWSSAEYGLAPFQVWQLVTYGFLHQVPGWTHIFFNMFALFMFGSEIERLFGTQRYLIYYFVTIIGAALAHLTVVAVTNAPPHPVVGASGGVFGILLAFGMSFPHRRIMLLIPPIPMPAWLFVTLYGLIELAMGVFGTQQGVAHFAHLGGMAAGYLLIRYWRRGRTR